jgi:hypothetical protein
MSVEKLKSETKCFLYDTLATWRCAGGEFSINGLCVVTVCALVFLHVILVKHFCSCKKKLKQKLKETKAELNEN